MLKFTKGFIKNTNDKIATNYNIISDQQKMEEIKKRLHPDVTYNIDKNIDKKQEISDKNYKHNNIIGAMKNIDRKK